jgi:hypothetical protein
MRLEDEEIAQLRRQADVVVFRWGAVRYCDLGHCYTADGTEYTVMRRETMTRSDVLRKLGAAVYRSLTEEREDKDTWPNGVEHVEKITLRYGDHTDRPKFMHKRWSPTTGDYTTIRGQAAEDGGEVVSAAWLDKFSREAAEGIAQANQAHANRVADARRKRGIQHRLDKTPKAC